MISLSSKGQLNNQRHYIIAAVLLIVVLMTRLPFQTKVLYHWDSVNFANALQEFDIAKDQPQPPGYILYVILVRGIDLLIQNAQLTMVVLSILSSSLAVMVLYVLGREIFNWKIGLVAALFLGFSPLFWFYGEIALPHTLDTFLVVLCVLMLYKVHVGKSKNDILTVFLLAVAGGFRPQTLVFLLPLTIYAFRKISLKRFVGLGVLGGLICLIWFIPLIHSSGGMKNYFTVLGEYSDRFQTTTSLFKGAGIFGIKRNSTKIAIYTVYGLAASLSTLLFVPAVLKRKLKYSSEQYGFFLLWILPSGLYYLLVHMGQQGLIFIYLPALFLILAVLIVDAFDQYWTNLGYVTLLICILNAGIFLFVPEYPFASSHQRLLTRDTLRNSDDYFQQRFDVLQYLFTPESTLIIATNWHHVNYYLSEYQVIPFEIGDKWEVDEGDIYSTNSFVVSANKNMQSKTMNVILFDPELNQINLSPDKTKQISLSDDQVLQYFELTREEILEIGSDYIKLLEPQSVLQ